MNAASIIVCVILGILIGFVITKIILDKKKGKGGCGGNCAGCHGCNKDNNKNGL